METSVGNEETVLFETIPLLLYVKDGKVTEYPVASLRSLLGSNTRIMMFTQRSANLSLIVYEY